MTRLRIATAFVLAVLAVPAAAQPVPRAELFGGYSLVRRDGETRHGWNASLACAFGARLSLAADAGGHSGTTSGVDTDRLSFAAGPRLVLLRSGGVTVFAHALAGVVRESAGLTVFGVSISERDTRFGGYAGGGLDLRLGQTLALRLAQVDYAYVSKAAGASAGRSGLRASAGLVLRLGKR